MVRQKGSVGVIFQFKEQVQKQQIEKLPLTFYATASSSNLPRKYNRNKNSC